MVQEVSGQRVYKIERGLWSASQVFSSLGTKKLMPIRKRGWNSFNTFLQMKVVACVAE